MKFEIDRKLLKVLLDATRDDKRAKPGVDSPFIRIEARAVGIVAIAGIEVECECKVPVKRAGVLFVRARPLRDLLELTPKAGGVTIEVDHEAFRFGRTRFLTGRAEFLYYPDIHGVPRFHPGDRQTAQQRHEDAIDEARRAVAAAKARIIRASEDLEEASARLAKLTGAKPDHHALLREIFGEMES